MSELLFLVKNYLYKVSNPTILNFFSVALRPSAGHGLLILEVF